MSMSESDVEMNLAVYALLSLCLENRLVSNLWGNDCLHCKRWGRRGEWMCCLWKLDKPMSVASSFQLLHHQIAWRLCIVTVIPFASPSISTTAQRMLELGNSTQWQWFIRSAGILWHSATSRLLRVCGQQINYFWCKIVLSVMVLFNLSLLWCCVVVYELHYLQHSIEHTCRWRVHWTCKLHVLPDGCLWTYIVSLISGLQKIDFVLQCVFKCTTQSHMLIKASSFLTCLYYCAKATQGF